MNRACTIKAHNAGLFSLVNNVLTCMERYEHVHVDWSNSLYGAEDLYPKLFRQRSGPDDWKVSRDVFERTKSSWIWPEPPEAFDTITDYPDKWLTYNNVHKLYTGYQSWRNRLHPHWQSMDVLPHLTEFAECFARANFGAYNIGVLIRANTHAGEQVGGVSQSIECYANAIHPLVTIPHTAIYVMCQDEDSICELKGHFSQCMHFVTHPSVKRSPSRDIDRHLHESQTHEDAIVCMEEMLLLTKCDVLIHPISNIATTALIANPALKSIYLP